MTDENKVNEKEPTSPELTALEKKKADIENKIAILKEKEAKKDTRRKIIVGGWLLALARTDESFRELLENRLYPTLTNARDRELFKLPPLAGKPDTPKKRSPEPSQEHQNQPGPGPGKILVQFPDGNPGREILDAMKAAGKDWRWDSENSLWTGEADPEAVRNAVDPVAVEIREA